MKKLTRSTLDELAKVMPVLSEQEQRMYVGGYDNNDCWWRCIAYLKNCGSNYGASGAMALAQDYYGSSFNSNSYAFSGNKTIGDDYITKNVINGGSYCQGTIITFDPNDPALQSSGWSGVAGTMHAVILTGIDSSGNFLVFDAKNNSTGTIPCAALNAQSGAYTNKVK